MKQDGGIVYMKGTCGMLLAKLCIQTTDMWVWGLKVEPVVVFGFQNPPENIKKTLLHVKNVLTALN